jgi:hypothetical protein
MTIVEFDVSERGAIAPLFRDGRPDTVLIRSALQGAFGNAYADSRSAP